METANQTQTVTATVTATSTLSTSAESSPTALPTPPRALAIDFNGPELTEQLNETAQQISALETVAKRAEELNKQVLLDPSFSGRGNLDRRPPTGSDLTSAFDFKTAWDNNLIYTEGPPPITIESLTFNPNAAGKLFNMIDSRNYVMGAAVFVAMENALNAGWRGETRDTINRQLAAAKERLELLKAQIPKVSERQAIETYVRGVYDALSARVETIQTPLADLELFISTACNTLDLDFLSAVEGTERELEKVGKVARLWMIKPDSQVSADLNAAGERLANVAKQLLAASERIDSRRKRLGR